MSTRRDAVPRDLAQDAALRPLDARSIALSVLLGTHLPTLRARPLVALAGLFGIAGGTMRTALSRMVGAGELELVDGRYRLAGRLLERQRAQDIGRQAPRHTWDGTWHTVITAPDQRLLADRRRFRASMVDHRFGELRPDIWMRPANLDPPPPATDLIVTAGAVAGIDPLELRDRLWDLDALRTRANALGRELERLQRTIDWSDPAAIPGAFVLSARVVRFLRDEPLLPDALLPQAWPAPSLRHAYDAVEQAFQAALHTFLVARA